MRHAQRQRLEGVRAAPDQRHRLGTRCRYVLFGSAEEGQRPAGTLPAPNPIPLSPAFPLPLLQALKRYSAARSDWEAILLLKPHDAKASEKQAALFVMEGRLDAAVAAYESLLHAGRAGSKAGDMQQTLQVQPLPSRTVFL